MTHNESTTGRPDRANRFRQLTPNEADIRQLIDVNPLAGEQLKVIILNRLLEEAEGRLNEVATDTLRHHLADRQLILEEDARANAIS